MAKRKVRGKGQIKIEAVPVAEAFEMPFVPPAIIPRVQNPSTLYALLYGPGGERCTFRYSEYDLAEIGRVEDVESYVRRSFDIKLGLMFKEGFTLTGANPDTIAYIKKRFDQMAVASGGIDICALLRAIGQGIVKKSNAFVCKVRSRAASGGKVRTDPVTGRTIEPIAAMFPIPPETMRYKIIMKEPK
jgi:hypothetical protein